MQRSHLSKNLFQSFFDPNEKSVVFISYKRDPDRSIALRCADILQNTPGVHYWLDEEHAEAKGSDIEIAECIEQGLDVSSALLGIIGRRTFNSPWIPYEIGGARGRQRFNKIFAGDPSAKGPHPLIAHLIHDIDLRDVPAFVGLGYPLTSLEEVENWAAFIAEILQKQVNSLLEAKRIAARHGINEIYQKNIRKMGLTSRL